ncbi:MAG: hypothetical protein SF053_15095 [Bacteroidia bacterium]|nr:hypothetical protein [Bacteroidia bacterium]
MRRYLTDSLTPGEVLRREYGLVSVGYTYQLLSRYSIRLDALGEVNYRHGFETVYIFQPQWFEIKVESPALRDLGASAGLRISYDLPFHFQLSGEAKYTRFLYLYDEGVDIFGDHKDPTANTLTLKLGLGYRF